MILKKGIITINPDGTICSENFDFKSKKGDDDMVKKLRSAEIDVCKYIIKVGKINLNKLIPVNNDKISVRRRVI